VSVAVAVSSRTDQGRELALRLIGERPGVQQRALVPMIQEETDLATSTISRLLQGMERDGVLDGQLDGRRKAYVLPGAAAVPATEPRTPAQGVSRGSRSELVAVVTALFVAASLVAFVLAPDRNGDTGAHASAAPVAAPEPAASRSEPAPAATPKPKPKAKPRNAGALAAAKRTEVAVLSGSAVPGIAKKTGAALKRRGFRVGMVTNATGPSQRSLVLYARGKMSAARALARNIKLRAVKPVDPSSQAIAPKAGLIVVVGADRQL
jgi:LytR cell envelope-related transcriptional attenuator